MNHTMGIMVTLLATLSHSKLVKYSSLVSGPELQTVMLYLPLWCQFCTCRAPLSYATSGLTFKIKLAEKQVTHYDIFCFVDCS